MERVVFGFFLFLINLKSPRQRIISGKQIFSRRRQYTASYLHNNKYYTYRIKGLFGCGFSIRCYEFFVVSV